MQTRGRRVNRWLAAGAAALIALGSTFVIVGTASASAPVGHFPVIKFWPNYNVVTMTVPLRVWCPKSKPFCEWQLYVNEPDIPSQKFVGKATGTSGILTVNYPKHFCGVIQADALVGPAPWLFQFGHKRTIHTGRNCDPNTTTTTKPPHTTTTTGAPNTTTTTKPPHTTTTKPPTTTTKAPHTPTTETPTSELPFTSTSAAAVVAAASASTTSTVAVAQLPFTGADIRPVAFVGVVLIMLGFYILTTLEQRRRAMRRMAYSMRTSSAAGMATRTTRWFLGD
jgi:hypothetical protein